LDVVSVRRADGTEIMIHAMVMRPAIGRFSVGRSRTMTDETSHGRSTAGMELTDEVLEEMAREAEAGLDVTRLRRRPGRPAMGSGPAETLPVRLEPELRQALDDRAAAEHTSASDVVRRALRQYLKVG
jgi:hypothetical protein